MRRFGATTSWVNFEIVIEQKALNFEIGKFFSATIIDSQKLKLNISFRIASAAPTAQFIEADTALKKTALPRC